MLTRTDPPGGVGAIIGDSNGDQLLRVDLDGRTWTYDANRNMRTATNLDGGIYTYDTEGATVTDPNGWVWTRDNDGDELSCIVPGGCTWTYDATTPRFTVTNADSETDCIDYNSLNFEKTGCHWEAAVQILSTDEVAQSIRRVLKASVEDGSLPAAAKYAVKTTRYPDGDMIEITMQSRALPGVKKNASPPLSAEEIAGALVAMQVIYDTHGPSRTTDREHFYDINYIAQSSESATIAKVRTLMSSKDDTQPSE
jgi:hypothetical protein